VAWQEAVSRILEGNDECQDGCEVAQDRMRFEGSDLFGLEPELDAEFDAAELEDMLLAGWPIDNFFDGARPFGDRLPTIDEGGASGPEVDGGACPVVHGRSDSGGTVATTLITGSVDQARRSTEIAHLAHAVVAQGSGRAAIRSLRSPGGPAAVAQAEADAHAEADAQADSEADAQAEEEAAEQKPKQMLMPRPPTCAPEGRPMMSGPVRRFRSQHCSLIEIVAVGVAM